MEFGSLMSVIFTEEEQKREDLWAQQKKYYAARMTWKKRMQIVPSGKRTWAQWFEKMFGENLEKYAKRMAEKKPQ
jgi:predicted RNA-binding protein (virulence factor B family)